ncbi:OsmC family protein [Chitinimonas lacunae]|uniref:OsmC family protein n=1 Tax=Chitinimonas lacunae TaxID=1963018 RepID=A0ABV8MLQ1_9NEIS
MSEATSFTITLTQQQDYRFLIDFGDGLPNLLSDESPPVGHGEGPAPSHLLAAAVANCLSASLLFALRKYKNHPEPLKSTATVQMNRNAQGRLRIGHIAVSLEIGQPEDALLHRERILSQFEDFCVVTQSVNQGIPVSVTVRDAEGQLLHETRREAT